MAIKKENWDFLIWFRNTKGVRASRYSRKSVHMSYEVSCTFPNGMYITLDQQEVGMSIHIDEQTMEDMFTTWLYAKKMREEEYNGD